VIINSAASVNFNDPLQEALQINYFGSRRILALAKECKVLETLCHVSTAYVNCYMDGYIEEEIYNPKQEVEEVAAQIMRMGIDEVAKEEKNIIGNFPNTYTFTKNMAEKYLN